MRKVSQYNRIRTLAFLGFLMLLSCTVMAQNKVTGKVTDSQTGEAIQGVTVSVSGTNTATQTDAGGNFSIEAAGDATLLFTSVNYEMVAEKVGGRSNISIKMAPLVERLSGVVINIGYGTAKKSDLTGSVAIISSKDFNEGPITTPEQLISGKAAGVLITPNNGAPGSGSSIRIRGGSSLNASNDPLIVVDGMPLSNSGIAGVGNALALINPNDIATFTILKDASATAIYGSRASNGVILITTKKGTPGKPRFSFTTQLSAGELIKKFPTLSVSEFRNLVNTYGSSAQKALLGNANTDWQDQIYRTAISTDNNLSVTGSLKNLPYRLSVGYLNQNGIIKTSNLERISAGLNLNPTLFNDHLKIDLNLKSSFSKSRFSNDGAVWGAIQFDPTQPVYSGNNRFGGYWERLDPSNTVTGLSSLSPKNPLGTLEQYYNLGNANRLIANVALDYKFHFFPDLRAVADLGYDISKGFGNVTVNDSAAMSYKGFKADDGTYHGGSRSHYDQRINNSYSNFYLNYSKNINSENKLEIMAGVEYQRYFTTNYNFKSYTYDSTVTNTPAYPFDKPENRILSFLGRANYSWNNMLFLTASMRRDGTSKFAPAQRWGNFPSAAVAWKFNDLLFKESGAVNELKLRLGYGVTGQQDGIGNYDYISYYDLSDLKAQYRFGNDFYRMYRPGGYYANRKWEQTATTNIGIDYGFFDNRVSGSIEYYFKKTTDLLNQITQPAFTNFSNTIVANVGSMENRGVEFSINVQPIRTKDIVWDVMFNTSYNKNEITKLSFNKVESDIFQIAGIGGNGGVQANALGYPRASFYVFKQVYDEKTGKPIEDLFVDFNRDGKLNTNDLYVFKSPDPKVFFGFSTRFTYKEWDISTSLRANVGNYVYNQAATNSAISKFLFSSYLGNNSPDVLTTGFVGQGDFYQSNYYVQNASFLKMDNLNIGYDFGSLGNGKLRLRANASVQNVFVVTNYKGIDPEVGNGIDNNPYPRPRTYLLGIGLNF